MTRALVILLLAAAASADRAVGRDGSIVERKEFRVDAAAGVALVGEKEYPLSAYDLVEKDDGTCLWAAGLEERVRAYGILAREERRKLGVRLLKSAVGAKDARLARSLYEQAQRDGFWGRSAASMAKRVESLEERTTVTPSKKAARIRTDAARIPRILPDLLVERAARDEGDASLHLLREALRLDPRHAAAAKLLAGRAPKDFPLGSARRWLDWRLDVESKGARFAEDKQEKAMVDVARRAWRKDAYGVRSGPILLMSALEDTRLLGRSLACGRLTCDVLSELFKDYPRKRERAIPMRVFLYSSKAEYQKQSTARTFEDPAFLEWTAGHYSPMEGVSRFYWHEDRDAERRIIGTCVHELTHHWLEEQNPAYAAGETRTNALVPGYWIVEGFATFMEEGSYDIDTGEWTLFEPRCRSLDVVAAVAAKDGLQPWERVFRFNQMQFRALDHEPRLKFVRHWALGYGTMSDSRVFYEQAAATCQYLYHAEKGEHRKRLLDYIVSYYTGQKDKLSTLAAFGLSEKALGERVLEYAHAVAKGWRPE